jgi:tRNA (guanine-N7-)-methyltransferase
LRSVRQHVNPLGLNFQTARAEAYARPQGLSTTEPLEVELGCADAQFAFELARQRPERPVVGLEIREKLVEINRRKAIREGLSNLYFGYVNLNVDLDRVFEADEVARFHLLFPDPWFKARHQKRRVLDERLCQTLAQQLRRGGEVHMASDVFEIALDAMEVFESSQVVAMGFLNLAGAWSFSRENPTGIASKREETTLARGQRVWRLRYQWQAPGEEARLAPLL